MDRAAFTNDELLVTLTGFVPYSKVLHLRISSKPLWRAWARCFAGVQGIVYALSLWAPLTFNSPCYFFAEWGLDYTSILRFFHKVRVPHRHHHAHLAERFHRGLAFSGDRLHAYHHLPIFELTMETFRIVLRLCEIQADGSDDGGRVRIKEIARMDDIGGVDRYVRHQQPMFLDSTEEREDVNRRDITAEQVWRIANLRAVMRRAIVQVSVAVFDLEIQLWGGGDGGTLNHFVRFWAWEKKPDNRSIT